MAISLINNWSGFGTALQTTLAIDTSGGTQAQVGDLLVAHLENFFSAGNPTAFASAGWTVQVPAFTSFFLTSSVLTKVAVLADIGATFTFTNGGLANQWSGNISCWRGVDNTTPIDAAGSGSTGQTNAPTAASISPTTANNALLWFCTASSGTITKPTALTTCFNYAGSPGVYQTAACAYLLNNGTGATGTVAGALSTTDWWNAVLVALRPATVSAGSAIPRRGKGRGRSKVATGPKKRRLRSNIELRIPPAPKAVRAPLTGTRRGQKKRLTAGPKKRPLRSNLTKQLIPPAPKPVRAPLTGTRRGQKKRLLTTRKPVKRTLGNRIEYVAKAALAPSRIPHAPQRKRLAKVNAKKRTLRARPGFLIGRATSAAQPLPVRRASQKKRVAKAVVRRKARNSILELRIQLTPAAPVPLRRKGAQRKSAKRLPTTRRRKNAAFINPVVVTRALPLPLMGHRLQHKAVGFKVLRRAVYPKSQLTVITHPGPSGTSPEAIVNWRERGGY